MSIDVTAVRRLRSKLMRTCQAFWDDDAGKKHEQTTVKESLAALISAYVYLAALADEPQDEIESAVRFLNEQGVRKGMSLLRADYERHVAAIRKGMTDEQG